MPLKAKIKNNSSAPSQRPAPHAVSSPPSDLPSLRSGAAGPAVPPDFKEEMLASLRTEMAAVFKTELHEALKDNLSSIKAELQTVMADLSVSITNVKSDVSALKSTVGEMETSLSTCTDDISTLQAKVEHLSAELERVDNRCEDLEARSRRNNVRIVGVAEETTITNTTAAISTLLKEAFKLEKEPLLDRAHRTLQPKPRPGERHRTIIARLHYHADCADILRRARAQQRIKIGDFVVSIFPDHTSRTARARTAFNDVRRQLREIPGIRFGLLYPGRLRIMHGGTERQFNSPDDAETFIKTLVK
ncbi:LINE-1 retrotransposable element ORF1 protein [Dissostichus eleginoides]|uniref:LINE-1 retrotransposable element ORF1 protein n=1 Tax=Dissostichus eleginoides TaxID=100907 RepID=A0AAD9CIC6_DISEL|nr:LINE-1 retrotransposable element ORF1 protein [Dissostichus eleginoides]